MGKGVELALPASVLFAARTAAVPFAEVSAAAAKTPEPDWMKSRRVTPAFRLVGMVHLSAFNVSCDFRAVPNLLNTKRVDR
jgi:hypothetical protein